MNVLATRLGTQLSITLVDDGSGWRFGSWSTMTNRCPAEQPSGTDRQRRFAEVSDALRYFRERYRLITG